jgi:WD40 repeat protein
VHAGTSLVSAATDGSVIRWDARSGQVLAQHSFGDDVSAAALSGAGDLVAVATFGDRVQVREVDSWQSRVDVPEGAANVRSLALSPDGALLAAGDEEGAVTLIDVSSGTVIGVLDGRQTSYVTGLAFSADAARLAAVSTDGTLLLHDTAEHTIAAGPVQLSQSRLNSVDYAPDGRTIAVGEEGNRVQLVDVATSAALGPPLTADVAQQDCTATPCDSVLDVGFSADSAHVVGASTRSGAVVWDVTGPAWVRAACLRAARELTPDELRNAELDASPSCL